MSKSTITLQLDSEAKKILEKRAKKEFFTIQELVEDIIRRSVISYKGKTTTTDKVDDKFLTYFSKQNKGRKPKKK